MTGFHDVNDVSPVNEFWINGNVCEFVCACRLAFDAGQL